MSFTPEFVEHGRGIIFTASGDLTAGEILAAKADLLSEPDRVRKLAYGIVLLDAVTNFSPTSADIEDIAKADERIARLAPDVAVAVVAPSDYLYGLSRMWEVFAEATRWRLSVFRSRAEAHAWIRSEMASRSG